MKMDVARMQTKIKLCLKLGIAAIWGNICGVFRHTSTETDTGEHFLIGCAVLNIRLIFLAFSTYI